MEKRNKPDHRQKGSEEMTKQRTIQEVAQEMSDNLETKKRNDGTEYICKKIDIKWQKDIIWKAHDDKLPDDYIYEFIQEALDLFADCTGDEEEAIYEIEADCYTSDLTKWLNSRNDRVYYLTEALEEFEIKDGFQLLAVAQQREKQEVAQAVLQGIKDYLESEELC